MNERARRGVGAGAARPDLASLVVALLALVGAGVVAAAVAASAIAGAGPALAAEPSPLEVFRRYIHDRDPAVRRKAVAALAEVRGSDVVAGLLEAFRDEDPGVRDRAESALLSVRDRTDEIAALAAAIVPKAPPESRLLAVRALTTCGRGGAPPLRLALADKDAAVRCAAARGLATIGDRDAVRDLHVLLTHKEPLVRAAAMDSIGDLSQGDAVGTATAVALGDRAPEPRIAAVRVLARYPSIDVEDAVVRCLGDAAWSLRTAAARALAEFGRDGATARPAAAALVAALAKEDRNRVRVEFGESLWTLTAIDFGPDAPRWTQWFKETGGRFDPPAQRPTRRIRDAGATHGGLGDLPLESEHVCFVFDASHSMSDPIRFGAERTKRDDLQDAFEAVVEKLPRGSWINLIPFSTAPMPMKPALFEATSGARQATIKHLAKTPPDGRTNIYDALELALSDPDADTIVLLTDGAPSAGKRTQRTGIIDGVREMNRYRLARIHTVEIGAASTGARWKGFLKDLADSAGGHYLAR